MKKLIAIILAIATILTLTLTNALAETYADYVTYHKFRMWIPEDVYEEDLLADIDLESISIYNLYPSTARVIVVDLYQDIVVMSDGYNEWLLEGAEDWQVGDLASLLMFDSFTGDNVKDDIILLAWYAGNI